MTEIVLDQTDPAGGLVIFEKTYTPAALFVPGACDPLLAHIRAEVTKEDTDPSTPDGRKRIVSLAMKVTRTKTAIEAARKALVSDEKARLAKIDAEGKRLWDDLETLAKTVRQPVTDFENREKDRIVKHEMALDAIKNLDDFGNRLPCTAEIAAKLDAARAVSTDGFEEFTTIAAGAKAEVVERLETMLAVQTKADADAIELARLRQEAADREQREREAEIAAKAKADAEEAARIREEGIARLAAEALAKAERDRAEAEERAQQAERNRIAAAEQAERDRVAAAEKAERDRVAAEDAAKRREEEAAQRERNRIAAEQTAEAEATAKRERDKAHRGAVNRAAAEALVCAGLSADAAKRAVTAIAKGEIPAVKISY